MFERLLSARGRRIFYVVALGMLGYAFWLLITGRGVVAWLNDLQARTLFSGYYYPELTILVLCIPILGIGFGVALLHDYVTGQGIFAGYEAAGDLAKPTPNGSIEYQAATRSEVINQVRSTFGPQIRELRSLGFEELGFYREIVPWFGLPLGVTGLLGAVGVLANEVTRMGPNLTVNAFFILMASRDEAAYACVSKLGVNFYTGFTDGACLNTSDYKGVGLQDDGQKLYKYASPGPLAAAWEAHKERVRKFLAEGKTASEGPGMPAYFSMLLRLNDYMLKHRSKLSQPAAKKRSFAAEAVSAAVSTIVSLGILGSIVLAFALSAGVVKSIYPSCWFVRNMGIMPPALNLLAVFGLPAVSWAVARLRHDLFTVDGIGTRLYGSEAVSNPDGYISTKWLALPGVPLLPVRSYLFAAESANPWDPKTYVMRPLNAMNWAQVRGTVRRSWLGYSILTLLYAAFTAWSVLECM
jgi:hypothetical protein